MNETLINEVLTILVSCWKFDVELYKQWWMYAPLCIPACFYTAFFFCKWSVLTAPVWLPISLILQAARTKIKKN